VYLTSEVKVTDFSPQVTKYVKATVITFSLESVRIVEELTFIFARFYLSTRNVALSMNLMFAS